MLYDVFEAGTVSYNGKIWVFGGHHKTSEASSEWTAKIQIYDPATDSWEYYPEDIPYSLYTSVAAVYEESI